MFSCVVFSHNNGARSFIFFLNLITKERPLNTSWLILNCAPQHLVNYYIKEIESAVMTHLRQAPSFT